MHVTLDLAGCAPTCRGSTDYAFDEARAGAVYEAIRRYWPGLSDGALGPGYTGIRPKLGAGGHRGPGCRAAGTGRSRRSRPGQSLRHHKSCFRQYDACLSSDFVFSKGGRQIDLLQKDIDDWKITFVDTGQRSNIGERLRRVRKYVDQDEVFLANYSDGVSDFDLDKYVDSFL